MKKIFIFITACLFLLPLLASCKESGDVVSMPAVEKSGAATQSEDPYKDLPNVVIIEMEDGGKIKIELYPDIAPITVSNFKKLVSEHFYDGLTFHRVIKGFMIQGGDPNGDGTGGPGYTIKGEFAANGVKNTLSHTRGVVSMARRGDSYNSAGSQFFIMHADNKRLDGDYAAFGRVIEGMDVVDKIANVKTDSNDKPLQKQVIKSIKFEGDTSSDVSSEVSSQSEATASEASEADINN
jgi:peptidyl-prolyl cis-trans isomerase B (cyclophilin B)